MSPTLPVPSPCQLPPREPACCPFPPAQGYELQANTYRCSLEPLQAGSAPTRPRVAPLQESIQAQVREAVCSLAGGRRLCCLWRVGVGVGSGPHPPSPALLASPGEEPDQGLH